jgi:hypothetical protein
VRRLASDRYRRELDLLAGEGPSATSFTHDHGIDWSAYRLDREFREIPGDGDARRTVRLDRPGRRGNPFGLTALAIALSA